MTDRIRQLTVVLDADYRDTDSDYERIVDAIRMVRGVADVEEHVVEGQDHAARMTVRADVERDLHSAIDHVFRRKDFERSVADRKDRK